MVVFINGKCIVSKGHWLERVASKMPFLKVERARVQFNTTNFTSISWR